MSVEVTKDNVGKVAEAIREISRRRVLVGIPAEKATREDGSPINNAALGYIHNYGAPEANIPERPFMEPGVAAAKDMIIDRQREAARAAFEGRMDIADKQLNAMGLQTADAIRNQITQGLSPALAESTLRARRARGHQGETPLLEYGYLLRSITYVIRKLGGR
jgi:hypothetical protein